MTGVVLWIPFAQLVFPPEYRKHRMPISNISCWYVQPRQAAWYLYISYLRTSVQNDLPYNKNLIETLSSEIPLHSNFPLALAISIPCHLAPKFWHLRCVLSYTPWRLEIRICWLPWVWLSCCFHLLQQWSMTSFSYPYVASQNVWPLAVCWWTGRSLVPAKVETLGFCWEKPRVPVDLGVFEGKIWA